MLPRWEDDDQLLADLADAVGEDAALSRTVAEQAYGVLAWRTVDEDLLLASLSFDSSLEREGASRSEEGEPRILVFTATPLSVELELGSDRILGQIIPPGPGEIVVEGQDGNRIQIEADELGFFIVPTRPAGPVRLRCDTSSTRLITDWVRM